MNKLSQNYRDLHGDEIVLQGLADLELALIERIKARFQSHPDWNDFDNFWMAEVAEWAKAAGLSRPEARQSAAYRIAQDLSARLAVQAGMARFPDYRDELDDLIRSRFATRRAFCQATGLTEDMLSHVLAKRKQLGIETLATALSKIGYELKIVPKTTLQQEPFATTGG